MSSHSDDVPEVPDLDPEPASVVVIPIKSVYCAQYQTMAHMSIEHDNGVETLIVRYARGAHGGEPEFRALVPRGWIGSGALKEFLERTGGREWPVWEIPARVFGSDELFNY